MSKKITILLSLGLALLPFTGAWAEDGPWICSLTQAVECSEGVGCGQPDFQGVEPLTFLHVDLKKKVFTLLAPASRRGETSEIDTVAETSRGWIASGHDAERAWTIYLTHDGIMTLTVTMDGTTWSAFGRCLADAAARP